MTAERDVFQEAIASLCLLWTQGPRGLGQHLSRMDRRKGPQYLSE